MQPGEEKSQVCSILWASHRLHVLGGGMGGGNKDEKWEGQGRNEACPRAVGHTDATVSSGVWVSRQV